MQTINIWSILVAAVAGYIIGALWYSPILFGKEWMSLTKLTDKDMEDAKKKGLWKYYLGQLIISIVTYGVLGFLIVAVGATSALDGALFAIITWLGFIAMTALGTVVWEKKPLKLILINIIGSLASLIVGGAIIGGWN